MNKKETAICIIVTIWSMLFSGCLKQTDESIYIKAPTKIRIAQIIAISESEPFIFFNQSYIDKNKTSWIIFTSGNEVIKAIQKGEVDIAYVGTSNPILATQSNQNFKIISGTNAGSQAFIVRSDAKIRSICDLRNKTIAIHGWGTPNEILVKSVILPRCNLSPSDTKFVIVKPPEQMIKLREGTIDAVEAHEPWVSRIILNSKGNGRILVDSHELWRNGSYPTATVVARTEFIKKHPELVKEFLRAHVDAVLFANSHPEETKKIVHDEILRLSGKELPMKVIESAFTRVKLTYDPQVDAVMELANFTHQAYPDMLPRIPTKKELFDLSLLNEVLAEKGLPPVKT